MIKYMVKKKGAVHLWDGKDTFCRMWSTGGIKAKKKYVVTDQKPNGNICNMCEQNISTSLKSKFTNAKMIDDIAKY